MKKEFGRFLVELRKESRLSQYELADLIPISREAVSKWERGKTYPSKSSLNRLSEIFNISIEELLAGKKINKKDKNQKNGIILDLYENSNRKQKIIFILTFVIIFLIISFFGYYFLVNYNSIKVYSINYADDNCTITNGILVVTKEKLYFNIGNIEYKDEIENLELYYGEKENTNLIYSADDNKIVLYDFYGYNSYFNYDNISVIVNHLFLTINSNETIQLEVKKDFANTKFFYKKEKSIVNNFNDSVSTSKVDVANIKKKFEYEDDMYIYERKNNTFYYIEEANIIVLLSSNKKNKKEWSYNLISNFIIYNEYEDGVLINSFNFDKSDFSCNIDNCNKNLEEVHYFYDELNKILQ